MEKNACTAATDAITVEKIEAAGSSVTVARRPKRNVKVLKRELQTAQVETVPKAETKRVAAYCRVSTDKEEQESSLQVQMESFRKLIEGRPGWELVDIYADV